MRLTRRGERALVTVALALSMAFLLACAVIGLNRAGYQVPAHAAIAPCQEEDGPGPCHWDAQDRGDGTGRSFTMAADGTVSYDDGRP